MGVSTVSVQSLFLGIERYRMEEDTARGPGAT